MQTKPARSILRKIPAGSHIFMRMVLLIKIQKQTKLSLKTLDLVLKAL